MEKKQIVLALGMFDGVHTGHRELIRKARQIADEKGLTCLVYTFQNHPMKLLDREVRYLTSAETRRLLLLEAGAHDVVMEPFTEEIMDMSPEQFISGLLGKWAIHTVVTGFNFTFGAKGAGTTETLKELGKQFGFSTEIIPAVEMEGEVVSSSAIREALKSGQLDLANQMLGRVYCMEGRTGETGEIFAVSEDNMLPLPGRYAGILETEDSEEYCMIHIRQDHVVETVIFDNKDLFCGKNGVLHFKTMIELEAGSETDCGCFH